MWNNKCRGGILPPLPLGFRDPRITEAPLDCFLLALLAVAMTNIKELKTDPKEEYEFFEYVPTEEELPTEALTDFTVYEFDEEDFEDDDLEPV